MKSWCPILLAWSVACTSSTTVYHKFMSQLVCHNFLYVLSFKKLGIIGENAPTWRLLPALWHLVDHISTMCAKCLQ